MDNRNIGPVEDIGLYRRWDLLAVDWADWLRRDGAGASEMAKL